MKIIELAKEAGFGISNQYKTPEVLDGDGYGFITNEIERFAALVAAHEREALAEQEKQEPVVNDADRSDAYDVIDRFLRNNLDDSDYEDYSTALDTIYAAPVSVETAVLAESYACEAGECPDKSLCAGACECLFKAEPVKQEPVAWMVTTEGLDGTPKTYPITGRYKDVCDVCDFGDPEPLYAAPVDAKAIGDALLFLVERCNEQGFYSPIKQPIVQTALAAIRSLK